MYGCALLCEPSELKSNGANGECGTGSCQSISGVGLCTYASSGAQTVLALGAGTNPTHYGDPKTGCESDEQAVQVRVDRAGSWDTRPGSQLG